MRLKEQAKKPTWAQQQQVKDLMNKHCLCKKSIRASSQARLKRAHLLIKRRDMRACCWWVQETQLFTSQSILLLSHTTSWKKPSCFTFDPSERCNYTRAADSFRRTVQCCFIRPFPCLVSHKECHCLTSCLWLLWTWRCPHTVHPCVHRELLLISPCSTTAGHTWIE